jgi:hypothetical protein
MHINIYRRPYTGYFFAEYATSKEQAWPTLIGHTASHSSLDDLHDHMKHLLGNLSEFKDAWCRAKRTLSDAEETYSKR